MKIKLTNTWFTPDNRLLKPGIHTVSDDWTLPSGTEEVEEDEVPAPKPVKAKAAAA